MFLDNIQVFLRKLYWTYGANCKNKRVFKQLSFKYYTVYKAIANYFDILLAVSIDTSWFMKHKLQ